MKTIITWAVPLYAVFTLIGMAPANIGFLLVMMAYLINVLYFKKPWNPGRALAQKTLNFHSAFQGYRVWGFALFFSCIVSLVAALLWPMVYADHAPEITIHGFNKIWYLICPFILLSVFLQTDDLGPQFKKMTQAWWIMTLIMGPVAIVQFYTGWPLLQAIPTNPGRFHAILFQGHHLSVASIFIFPTFTALACALGSLTRSRKILIFESVVGLTGILILFLSYARTAWLAIPIGIIIIFARYLNRKQLITGLATLAVCLALLSQTSFTKERISNSMGIQDRFRLWEANIDFFKHRPLTGIGWLKTQEMSEFYFKEKFPDHYHEYFWGHAHNNFFEMLGGTGLLGLIAFIGWMVYTLNLARKLSKQHDEYALAHQTTHEYADFAWGIFTALVLLHFNGLTNVTFWEGKVMHQQMLGVGFLLILGAIFAQKSKKASGI